jgi:hypothetical protein
MKIIHVNEIRGLRKVENTGDFHFLINEEINLYVNEDKITSLVILEKIKPPFELCFEDDNILYKENVISSKHEFEIIINSEHFSYFSVNNTRTKFALKGKVFGSEKIEKEGSHYGLCINGERICTSDLKDLIDFLITDNNRIWLNDAKQLINSKSSIESLLDEKNTSH